MLQHLLCHFSPTLLVSTLLLATYLAQQSGSPLLFLPAGLQIMAGFIYGLRALPGCIIGMGLGMALLSHLPLSLDTLAVLAAYGTLSTLCLLGLIQLLCRFGQLNHELAGLSYRHILVVVVAQATTDAALRIWINPIAEHPRTQPTLLLQWFAQASGNLLGSMSIVLSLFVLFALYRKLTSATPDAP